MELSIQDIRDLLSPATSGTSHSFKIGQSYFIRTVTYHCTGRLVAVTDTDLLLLDAAWIADSGRFADALEGGTLSEVEPIPGEHIVSRGALVDATIWGHPLPREQK